MEFTKIFFNVFMQYFALNWLLINQNSENRIFEVIRAEFKYLNKKMKEVTTLPYSFAVSFKAALNVVLKETGEGARLVLDRLEKDDVFFWNTTQGNSGSSFGLAVVLTSNV